MAIHGRGVFKVSSGLRVASTRISLKDEATERWPAPRRSYGSVAGRRAAAASRRRADGAAAVAAAAADDDDGVLCVCCEPPTIRAPIRKQTQRWCVWKRSPTFMYPHTKRHFGCCDVCRGAFLYHKPSARRGERRTRRRWCALVADTATDGHLCASDRLHVPGRWEKVDTSTVTQAHDRSKPNKLAASRCRDTILPFAIRGA